MKYQVFATVSEVYTTSRLCVCFDFPQQVINTWCFKHIRCIHHWSLYSYVCTLSLFCTDEAVSWISNPLCGDGQKGHRCFASAQLKVSWLMWCL